MYLCELNIPETKERHQSNTSLDDPQLQFSGQYCSEYSDMYVQCGVFTNGKPLCLPVRTSYKAFSKRWNWNEWIEIPLCFKDLPRNTVLGLTVYDIYGPYDTVPVGGTTIYPYLVIMVA